MAAKRKVFFALLPNKNALEAIVLLQKKFKKDTGRWIVAQNIHLTLCFIGDVDELQLECISKVAEQVEGEKIELKLDVIGQFNKAKILWLGSNDKCRVLKDLNKAIIEKLVHCQLKINGSKFHPHITLARKARRGLLVPEFESIKWCSEYFYLLESVQIPGGVQYKALKQYKLN